MRKLVLIILLIVTGIVCFSIVFWGIEIGNFKINSYSEIETENALRKTLLVELNEKNSVEFEEKKSSLNTIVSQYESKKSEYQKLVEAGKITDIQETNSLDVYDLNYINTVVEGYATEKGVTLTLDVFGNSNSAKEYTVCDLNFTITGDYISITEFISSLEDNDQLSFEIRDFTLEKGEENLQATFTVKEVPINNKDLASVPA